jgi:hypothetical protein
VASVVVDEEYLVFVVANGRSRVVCRSLTLIASSLATRPMGRVT